MTAEQIKQLDVQLPSLVEMEADMRARKVIMDELMAADPKLNFISALVMAGDKLSEDRAFTLLEEGMEYDRAVNYVGSFYRMDFAYRAREAGHITFEKLFTDLPELWVGADPDDSDPRFIELWEQLFQSRGFTVTTDDLPLPNLSSFEVFRGQDPGVPWGVSWSLDRKVAEKFANGAGTRQHNRKGVVLKRTVLRSNITAYLTARHESEVIINPSRIR